MRTETDEEISKFIREIIREGIRKTDENPNDLLASLKAIAKAAENIKRIALEEKKKVEASMVASAIKEAPGVSKKLVPAGYKIG